MKDLGYTPPKEERDKMAKATIDETEEPQYPSLRFNGEQAESAGLHECKFGEEYEITLRIKAVSIDGSSSYPGSGSSRENPQFCFDVLACDPPKEAAEMEEDEPKKDEEPKRKPKQRVVGPKEAGFSDDWKA